MQWIPIDVIFHNLNSKYEIISKEEVWSDYYDYKISFPIEYSTSILNQFEEKVKRFQNNKKVETGKTAQDFIADKIIRQAKELLNNQTLSIAQVSDHLGFGYPQHFIRFFKCKTGKTPTEYRAA